MKYLSFVVFLLLASNLHSQADIDFIQARGKKLISMKDVRQQSRYIQVVLPKLSLIQYNFTIYITSSPDVEGYVVNTSGDKYKFKTIPETLNKIYAMGYKLMPNVTMQNDLIENTTANIEIKYMFERIDPN